MTTSARRGTSPTANGTEPEERFTVSPALMHRLALAALVLLGIIVVTGAAVRLTGSGLGCSDWPRCSDTEVIGALSGHQGVEQANRLFTGAVSVAVVAAVLGALRRRPYRRDLALWAWSLVAGVIAQIVWGGITVLSHLNPAVVIGHFLISMVLVACATVLWLRSGNPEGTSPAASANFSDGWMRIGRSGRASLIACGAVLLTGPIVTGTGPHAGDPEAPRFGFALHDVARLHSATAWLLVASVAWFAVEVVRRGSTQSTFRAEFLVLVTLAQGALGYAQYAMGVPAALVIGHILGVTLLLVVLLTAVLAEPAAPTAGPSAAPPSSASGAEQHTDDVFAT